MSAQVPTPPPPWRTRFLGFATGLACAAAVVVVAIAVRPDEGRPLTDAQARRRDAAALLDAVDRERGATFTATGTFVRRAGPGATLTDEVVVVQQPPDRLVLGFGSWDGVVDGVPLSCTRDGRHGAWLGCVRVVDVEAGAESGDAAPTGEVTPTRMRDLVAGDEPTYRVSATGSGCFRMRLAGEERFTPEFGRRTDWCFDEATGATVRRVTVRDGAVDELRVDDVTDVVSRPDLEVPLP